MLASCQIEVKSIINIAQMDKTAQSELHRLFLIESLPEPLTPASRHLQIFDRYIEGTRIRLRRIRDPYSNEWNRILQKRVTSAAGAEVKLSEVHLDESEFSILDRLAGPELRKNRYFYEFDLVGFSFDVFLGPLKGITLARAEFEALDKANDFSPPVFSVIEVTNEPFFSGEHLVDKNFADVTAEIERLAALPNKTGS